MGLFSFIKNAGAKLFGKKDDGTDDLHKDDAAQAQQIYDLITSLGLGVNNLQVSVNGDVVTLSGNTQSIDEKEKAILTAGNVSGIATVSDNITVVAPPSPSGERSVDVPVQEPISTFHTVEKGETLSKIAKHYYDDAMKYPVIFEANRPMLKSPDLIYPGQVLRIPPMA